MKSYFNRIYRPHSDGENSDSGFTLIELVVAMAVSALVLTAVIFFIALAARQYSTANADVSMQMEAQSALNQTGDIIMEAFSGPYRIDSGSDTLAAYAVDATDSAGAPCAEIFVLDTADSRLLTAELATTSKEITADDVAGVAGNADRNLLAGHVSTFTLERAGTGGLISVRISFASGSRSQTVSGSYRMRNSASSSQEDLTS